jgi:hypothetical protein
MIVFAQDSVGDVKPKRILETLIADTTSRLTKPSRSSSSAGEVPERDRGVPETAGGKDQPLRILTGDRTGLEAPHGLVVDVKNQLLYVNNWGWRMGSPLEVRASFNPPSSQGLCAQRERRHASAARDSGQQEPDELAAQCRSIRTPATSLSPMTSTLGARVRRHCDRERQTLRRRA